MNQSDGRPTLRGLGAKMRADLEPDRRALKALTRLLRMKTKRAVERLLGK